MTDVAFKDAFDIYQKQSDSIHKLWAYFQVISIAVLGYTIGSDKGKWPATTYLLIAVSYFIFAMASQWVIVLSQKELRRFGEAVRLASDETGPVGKKLVVQAVKPRTVRIFHVLSTLIVLAAIGVTWYYTCPEPTPCKAQATTENKCP
jgi:hypothetical protein